MEHRDRAQMAMSAEGVGEDTSAFRPVSRTASTAMNVTLSLTTWNTTHAAGSGCNLCRAMAQSMREGPDPLPTLNNMDVRFRFPISFSFKLGSNASA
eukprot:2427187-Pyramimonas_sp.AAC.1